MAKELRPLLRNSRDSAIGSGRSGSQAESNKDDTKFLVKGGFPSSGTGAAAAMSQPRPRDCSSGLRGGRCGSTTLFLCLSLAGSERIESPSGSMAWIFPLGRKPPDPAFNLSGKLPTSRQGHGGLDPTVVSHEKWFYSLAASTVSRPRASASVGQ